MDKMVREILTVKTLFNARGAQTFQQNNQESPFLFLQANEFKPENVAAAIREVQPFGIDVCSGLRTEGKLDPQKLAAFFKAATDEHE